MVTTTDRSTESSTVVRTLVSPMIIQTQSPDVRTIFSRISRVLSRHNIKSVGLPPKKISAFLQPVKDNLGLWAPGVYRIPCECSKVYIGQTGRSVDAWLKEHQRHIHLEHPDMCAVAEHCVDLGHHIQFHNTFVLVTKTQYTDRVVREAIEIELDCNNMNREVGFCLSKSWKPLNCSIKKPDAESTRPHRSMLTWQSSPEAIGSMPTR
jgi:hypothetical protein